MRGHRVGTPYLELAQWLEPNQPYDALGCCLLTEAITGVPMISWPRRDGWLDWTCHYRWRLKMQRLSA